MGNVTEFGFKRVEVTCQFKEDFIKSFNEDCDIEYFIGYFKLMFNILKNYVKLHNGLPFSPERMKIEKVEKLAANLHDKKEYVIYIGNLEQVLIMD